jgi:hypothetical protein
MGYSECEVELDVTTLQVETSVAAPELEADVTNLELETSTASL